MQRRLNEVIAALPEARRSRVEARAQALMSQVEGLGELLRAAGKAQVEIARALGVRQPTVSRMERQADMYLSTLRKYVAAMGGELEIVVRLTSRETVRIERLGDVTGDPANN
ncbi:MAG: XRE family transcriptional regulator [Phenylobacterium sp.]